MSMGDPMRVLIADDSHLLVERRVAVLAKASGIKTVGQAETAAESATRMFRLRDEGLLRTKGKTPIGRRIRFLVQLTVQGHRGSAKECVNARRCGGGAHGLAS